MLLSILSSSPGRFFFFHLIIYIFFLRLLFVTYLRIRIKTDPVSNMIKRLWFSHLIGRICVFIYTIGRTVGATLANFAVKPFPRI